MTHRGSGRGKLILFGEHAAVYGHPAVGTALDCGTELTWQPETDEDVRTPDETGADRKIFLNLLHDAAVLFPEFDARGGLWHRRGTVPRAGGFGSSAALCVALSRIILARPRASYDPVVHEFANRLEGRFHGTPSGIDTGMAADDGMSAWFGRDGSIPERRSLSPPLWPLVYGALPRSATTAETVGRIAARRSAGDKGTIRSLEELGDIAREFIEACRTKTDFPRVAAHLTGRAQTHLADLGLSTPQLDQILDLAAQEGLSAGKLSGGGAGGAFFLCAADRHTRDRAMDRLAARIRDAGIDLTVPLSPLDVGS